MVLALGGALAVGALIGVVATGGNESENNIKTKTEQLNKVANEVITTFMNKTECKSTTIQSANIIVDGDLNGEIHGHQSIDTNLSCLLQSMNDSDNTIFNDMTNKVLASLKQDTDQKTKGLVLSKNSSKQVVDIDTITTNDISTIVRTEVTNVLKNSSDSDQNVEIHIRGNVGKTGKITWTQKAVITMIGTNIANNIVKNHVTTVARNTADLKVVQKTKQVAEGLTCGCSSLVILCSCVCAFALCKYKPYILCLGGCVVLISMVVSILQYINKTKEITDLEKVKGSEDGVKGENSLKMAILIRIIILGVTSLIMFAAGAYFLTDNSCMEALTQIYDKGTQMYDKGLQHIRARPLIDKVRARPLIGKGRRKRK